MKKNRILSLILSVMMIFTVAFPAGVLSEEIEVLEYEPEVELAVAEIGNDDAYTEDADQIVEELTLMELEEAEAVIAPEDQDAEELPEIVTVIEENEVAVSETVGEESSTKEAALMIFAEEELPFTQGYVRVKGGTTVYTTESMKKEKGAFSEDAIVYAAVSTRVADEAYSWLRIVFDTAEANSANEALLRGYVQLKDVDILSDEAVEELIESLKYDYTVRSAGDVLLPVVSFVPKTEEIVAQDTDEVVLLVSEEEMDQAAEQVTLELVGEDENQDEMISAEPGIAVEEIAEIIVADEASNTGSTEEQEATFFGQGYVRVKGGTTVYTTESMKKKKGVFSDDAIVYAAVSTHAADEAYSWLRIIFDAGDANGADEALVRGYVQAKDVVILSDEAAQLLIESLKDNYTVRSAGDILLPEVSFELDTEQIETQDNDEVILLLEEDIDQTTEQEELMVLGTSEDQLEMTVAEIDDVVVVGEESVEVERAEAAAVIFTTQPEDAQGPINSYVTFTVAAEGATAYQWQYNKGTSTWYDCGSSGYEGVDKDTLTAKVTSGRNGFKFRCVVTVGGKTAESDEATMTVGEAPVSINFTTQPEDAQGPVNSYVTFTVAAEGATAYQWQYNKGTSTWYDCGSSGYEGVDTDTLTAKVTSGRNGFKFRCVVTVGGKTAESDEATMTVGEAQAKITVHPEDASNSANEYVTFTVVAENAETYQWQYNKGTSTWYDCSGTGYEGVDTDTLTAKVTTGRNGFKFRCVVTGGGKTVESNAATMTIGAPQAKIISDPEDASNLVNEYVTFTVVAENAETYQWQYNKGTATWYNCSGSGYEGADTDTLSAKVTSGRDGFMFRCVVTGGGKTVESNAATMTVATQFVVDDVMYELLTTTTVSVVSYSGTADNLTIPQIVNNMTVTEIGEEAFMGNETLVSIDLPDTITVIKARAFKGCTNLSEMK